MDLEMCSLARMRIHVADRSGVRVRDVVGRVADLHFLLGVLEVCAGLQRQGRERAGGGWAGAGGQPPGRGCVRGLGELRWRVSVPGWGAVAGGWRRGTTRDGRGVCVAREGHGAGGGDLGLGNFGFGAETHFCCCFGGRFGV